MNESIDYVCRQLGLSCVYSSGSSCCIFIKNPQVIPNDLDTEKGFAKETLRLFAKQEAPFQVAFPKECIVGMSPQELYSVLLLYFNEQ